MFLNGALLRFWAVDFALSSWSGHATLTHTCNKATWGSQMGVSICKSYKAMFTLSFCCIVSLSSHLVLHLSSSHLNTISKPVSSNISNNLIPTPKSTLLTRSVLVHYALRISMSPSIAILRDSADIGTDRRSLLTTLRHSMAQTMPSL